MLYDSVILENVKSALGLNGDDQNEEINNKILAVQELIDLPDEIIKTRLGQALIVVGVTDLWQLAAGEIKFSPAYDILWSKLYNNYLKDDANES